LWQFDILSNQLSNQNWQLIDIESYIEGGKTLFSGVFRAGGSGSSFLYYVTSAELQDAIQDMRSIGNELIDFEVIDFAGGTRLYTGVFLPSSDNYSLSYPTNWDNFKLTITALRNQGYELVDLEVSTVDDVDPTGGGGVCIDDQGNEHIATHPDQDGTIDGEIIGTNGDDVIVGSSVRDVIYGMGGNDIICGGYGDDSIDGGSGDDYYISGEGGNDRIRGSEGDDFLFGGTDDDHIEGNSGENVLDGGSGDDRLNGGLSEPGNIIFGRDGTDRCVNLEFGEYQHECELFEGVPELFFP
jgi:Ca2+-binding RTX toxin-like protein